MKSISLPIIEQKDVDYLNAIYEHEAHAFERILPSTKNLWNQDFKIEDNFTRLN
jgi:hypothetical protein